MFARQHPAKAAGQSVIASLRDSKEKTDDVTALLKGLGNLWLAGVEIDWAGVHGGAARHRVPLPTYPFERQRYWVDPRNR